MTALLNAFYIFPDSSVFIEALIIGFVLALVGAGGYVLFVSSLGKDRVDSMISRRKSVSENDRNIWEKLDGENEADHSEREGVNLKKIILVLALVAVLALVIFIVVNKIG